MFRSFCGPSHAAVNAIIGGIISQEIIQVSIFLWHGCSVWTPRIITKWTIDLYHLGYIRVSYFRVYRIREPPRETGTFWMEEPVK